MNSRHLLTNPILVERLVKFLRKFPFPNQKQIDFFIHRFHLDPEEVKFYLYGMLSVILCGGVSEGSKITVDGENANIGKQIELEHVYLEGEKNVAIRRMQKIFIDKIRYDHNAENKTYYTDIDYFKKELKKETNKE